RRAPLPSVRVDGDGAGLALRVHVVQEHVALPHLPRAVRPLQGPLVSLGFQLLRVAAISPLTPDAATVTFEVPAALRESFRFTAGQHLTLRRELGGEDLRRTYSVCTSAVDGPLRVAVKRLEGGVFSTW